MTESAAQVTSAHSPSTFEELKAATKAIREEAEKQVRRAISAYVKAKRIGAVGDKVFYEDGDVTSALLVTSIDIYCSSARLDSDPSSLYCGIKLKKNNEPMLDRPSNRTSCFQKNIIRIVRANGEVLECKNGLVLSVGTEA